VHQRGVVGGWHRLCIEAGPCDPTRCRDASPVRAACRRPGTPGATCRLNSTPWDRCFAMASTLRKPGAPVNSIRPTCPPRRAHSMDGSMRCILVWRRRSASQGIPPTAAS
jgi:hypothetical protein